MKKPNPLLVAFEYMDKLQTENAIVSVQALKDSDCKINLADFRKLKQHEQEHPDEYKNDNVIRLKSTDTWSVLSGGQMYAFNKAFKHM